MAGKATQGDDDLIESGKPRELAHIWQPKRGEEGSWLIGILDSTEQKVLDKEKAPCTVAQFSSAAVKLPGKDWIGFRAVSCVLNKSILLRVALPNDHGKVFAIRFDGFEKSEKAGNADYRSFTVVEQSSEKLAEILRKAGVEGLPF